MNFISDLYSAVSYFSYGNLVIFAEEEDNFSLCLFVSWLFVNSKSHGPIFMKLGGCVVHGSEKNK